MSGSPESSKTAGPTRNKDYPVLTGLRFSPGAWAKLLYMLHAGHTEVAGFAVSDPDDLMLIVDFQTVKAECSAAYVEFDDDALADYSLSGVEQGMRPEQYFRIWIHTHPGSSPNPSSTDETTFRECLGPMDWAIMFIVDRSHNCYCRLRFNAGPGYSTEIGVCVDWSCHAPTGTVEEWEEEYQRNCIKKVYSNYTSPVGAGAGAGVRSGFGYGGAYGHGTSATGSSAANPYASAGGHAAAKRHEPPAAEAPHAKAAAGLPEGFPFSNIPAAARPKAVASKETSSPESNVNAALEADWDSRGHADDDCEFLLTDDGVMPLDDFNLERDLGLAEDEIAIVEKWCEDSGYGEPPPRVSVDWLVMYRLYEQEEQWTDRAMSRIEGPNA